MKRHWVGTNFMIQLRTKIPGPKSLALMEKRKAEVARGPFHVTPLFVSKAENATIVDVDGNHLLDFSTGIGVANTGHCPTQIVSAIDSQSQLYLHTSFNVVAYEPYIELCSQLNQKTPGNHPKKSFLCNSGAEAVENAIKIARSYTEKRNILCFEHAFHGRTFMAMSLTAKEKPYKTGFAPFCGNIYRAPYPYAYRSEDTGLNTLSESCFQKMKAAITDAGGSQAFAAIILEPVLGEGGFVVAPAPFLKLLREYCTQEKIILIADEIQSGFGRTGSLFACEQLGLVPDLITTAKGLGGGLPIAAVTGRAEVMDAPIEGAIGGTFGGNPLSCRAALAVFEMMNESFLKRAKSLGTQMEKRMSEWPSLCPYIGEVRGLGPMRAAEFVKDKKDKTPYPEITKLLISKCLERGLILMNAGTFGNVLRLLVPLTISDTELNEGFTIIESSLKELK
jgi:4-aminobutyrate aminotransferase / (S)-3-amino-2-methylpropionate transaminase / 5-aminovalerate transaminase